MLGKSYAIDNAYQQIRNIQHCIEILEALPDLPAAAIHIWNDGISINADNTADFVKIGNILKERGWTNGHVRQIYDLVVEEFTLKNTTISLGIDSTKVKIKVIDEIG